MTELEKLADTLARKAVYTSEMIKQAAPVPTPPVAPAGGLSGWWEGLGPAAQYGLIGAGVGGAGTGLISGLTGKRRKGLLRDVLLGAAAGGAGGAAIGYVPEVVEKIKKQFLGFLGPSVGKRTETALGRYKKALPEWMKPAPSVDSVAEGGEAADEAPFLDWARSENPFILPGAVAAGTTLGSAAVERAGLRSELGRKFKDLSESLAVEGVGARARWDDMVRTHGLDTTKAKLGPRPGIPTVPPSEVRVARKAIKAGPKGRLRWGTHGWRGARAGGAALLVQTLLDILSPKRPPIEIPR